MDDPGWAKGEGKAIEAVDAPFENDEFPSVAERLHDLIRRDIIRGRLRPGEKLVERTLAEKYRVSRTPVREALRRLTDAGLVEHLPRRGMVVAPITLARAREVFVIREALEAVAAREAAVNASEADLRELRENLERMREATERHDLERLADLNTAFHWKIREISRMSLLARMLDVVWDQIARLRAFSLAQPGRPSEVYQDHLRLYELIAAGDAEACGEEMRKHVRRAGRLVQALLEPKAGGSGAVRR